MTFRSPLSANAAPLRHRSIADLEIHLRRALIVWLCGLLILDFTCAQEPARTGSPDKQFDVRFHCANLSFHDESFTIVNTAGDVLFDSKTCPALGNCVGFMPEHLLWSPDSKTVAIEGGHSKLSTTYLFSLRGREFIQVPVPDVIEGFDNPRIVPLKWIKGRRLILGITGPHAGKATGYGYRGRTTLYVPVESSTCEVHYYYITAHDAEPDD